jgi:hypothetical protein
MRLPMLIIICIWVVCGPSATAQNANLKQGTKTSIPAASTDSWITRTFRVTRYQMRGPDQAPGVPSSTPGTAVDPFGPIPDGPAPQNISTPAFSEDALPLGGFPELPPSDAPDAVWAVHVHESTGLFHKLLRSLSIPAPDGMAALYDPSSASLVVRTTDHHMKELGPYLEALYDHIPRYLVFTTEVVQAESNVVRGLVEDTTGLYDHTKSWQRLAGLLKDGKAHSVGTFKLETKSGQRVHSDSGLESTLIDSLRIDSKGRVAATRNTAHSAVHFEVDPVMGPDMRSLDLKLKFHFDYAPPVERVEKIEGLGGIGTIESTMLDYRGTRLSTELVMDVGGRRLIGVWQPKGTSDLANANVMQAAFLHADALPVLPPENPDLAALLTKHAAPPPVLSPRKPAPEKPTEIAADGMEVRTIKLHPWFLSNAHMEKGSCSVKEMLEAQGIPFPEGASATLVPQNNALITRNTPKALDLIECYVEFVCQLPPQLVSCTVHLVEGDGATVRRLAEETHGISDHSVVWSQTKKLVDAGHVRIVETVRIDGRNGYRALFETGDDRLGTGAIRFADSTSDDEETEGDTKETAKGTSSTTEPSGAKTQPHGSDLISIQNEVCLVGTQFEMEPMISTDRETVDINYVLLHHYAPPTLQETAPKPGVTTPAGFPSTVYHCHRFVSASSFFSGTTRLVGIWKPEGSPAHEGKDIMQAAFLRVDVVRHD